MLFSSVYNVVTISLTFLFLTNHLSLRGLVNAGNAYELLSKGCDVAGGLADPPEGKELHDLALGGKFQKHVGCTLDEHCDQSNPCLGEFVCNAGTGTCEQVAGTAPVCDDGKKVSSLPQLYLMYCSKRQVSTRHAHDTTATFCFC